MLPPRCMETIAWCLSRVDEGLRSIELYRDDGFPRMSTEERFLAVEVVASRRAALLRAEIGPLHRTRPVGRWLIYEPDSTLWDGTSQRASDGYFDPYDCPPWDTWVLFSIRPSGAAHGLISWVPPQDVRRVERGIRANPVGCIQWLDSRIVELLGS